MNINPKHLIQFAIVADSMSFSRAAERLRLPQPWVSRQIRQLERQLGFDLFNRSTRRMELTEKGARLLERAQLVALHAEAASALAQVLAAEKKDVLSFGLPAYGMFVSARTDLFDRFIARNPAVRLDVEMGTAAKLLKFLVNGTLDAMFAIAGPGITDEPQLESMTLCEGGLDIVMPRTDALAAKRKISNADLRGRDMAVFSRPTNPEMFDVLFGAVDKTTTKLVNLSDYSFLRRLAERRLVTVLPAWQPLPSAGLVRRPFADAEGTLKFALIRHRAHRSALLDTFWRTAEDMRLQPA